MSLKILSDFHHSSLYSSFLYTLEARLGHEVYRQIGRKWFEQGYWKINRQEDTIQQYLGTHGYKPDDGTPNLNDVMWVKDKIHYSRDPNTGQVHKAIEYKTFMETDFDVIIASIPQHIEPFKKLAKIKKAKFIFQAGNMFPKDLWKDVPNFLGSIMPHKTPMNSIFYHQEFDTNIFSYQTPKLNANLEEVRIINGRQITFDKPEIHNYMNVLHNYPEAHEYFLELEKEMPEYTFKMYGSQNRDGSLTGVRNLADSMKKARWIFHFKPFGDGFGHCLFNSFAVGRPIITRKRDYEGKLGGTMMDDKSSVILDGLKPSELADIIRHKEENYVEMSKLSYRRFTENVDFEKEANNIQVFLEGLK